MDVTNDFQSSGINQGPGFGGFGLDLRKRGSKKALRSIEKEVFRSRADIKDQLIGQFREVSQEFREVDGKLCKIAKEGIKEGYENRLALAEAKANLIKEVLKNKYDLEKEIVISRFEAHKQVDALSKQVSDGFSDLKVDGVKDKLEAAINELNALRGQCNTSTLLSAIQGHWHGKC
jgi:predicted transcriptional regulator